jgi:hypothetical protein
VINFDAAAQRARQRSSVRGMNNLIAKIRGWFTTNKK